MSARDAILQNFWLKLFSLVLATMIWFAIAGAQSNSRPGQPGLGAVTRKIKSVSITVMQSANDFRAFRVEPNAIDVTVRGPIAEVQALTARQLEVFINLTDVHDTTGLNKKILVHSPAGIAVVQVSHTEARVTPANLD
ncbi:MAG: CdaR family protein [Limisphaerales bacterium]